MMRIVSIEPTPSPNTMKVILNEELPAGKSTNYKKDTIDLAPPFIKEILHIEGVKWSKPVVLLVMSRNNLKTILFSDVFLISMFPCSIFITISLSFCIIK